MRPTLAVLLAVVVAFLVSAVAVAADFLDVTRLGHMRRVNGATISGTTNKNLSKNEMLAADYFPVDTSAPGGATLDIDIGDDAAFGAEDIGAKWKFQIVTGSSAMTVTAGASGYTTVTSQQAGAGSTCEDAGDTIECTAYTTAKVQCLSFCAD